jgi:small subunit ribosomal protein S20
MANTSSAKKAARQTLRRTEVNRTRVTRIRTALKKVEDAIKTGDKKVAAEALREAQPIIARGAKTGTLHKNTASRKVSRLAQRIKKIGA